MPRKYNLGVSENPKRVISWECGVQSTALCVMSVLGDIPPVDYIIHADTGWERKATYVIRDWYVDWLNKQGKEVYIVSAGNIRTDEKAHADLPLWCDNGAPLRRQCTGYYKIDPVRRKIRELLGLRADGAGRVKRNSVYTILGISHDEFTRMKNSDVSFIVNIYPLVDLKITRQDCINYLSSKGLPIPPKSSCVCCPYTSSKRWLELKNNDPEEWDRVVRYDESIRDPSIKMKDKARVSALYLYKRAEPLSTANFEEWIDKEKETGDDVCESGYCFV